ncbi:hypothetical protein ABZX75_03915 [Streptomyces sp. NPDC003038]|uniref:hypothetical protein n=1 Tax=unclassified Streptomyces TaxID=2593676 RepID=UPI0033ABA25D
MPTYTRPGRVLSTGVVATVLLAGSVGCADKGSTGPVAASVPVTATAAPSASESPSPSATASPSPSASASGTPVPPGSAPASPATPKPVTPPAAPTRLAAAVQTHGGGLALVRGGAAQEFTVTLRNGNSAEYRHLLVAFQMESLVGEPGDRPGNGPGFLLERFDRASGTWRSAALRIANDVTPASLLTGGTPLGREAVRVERYRLRATAGGATGSSPLMVSFIDTDADRSVAAHVSLPHTTR